MPRRDDADRLWICVLKINGGEVYWNAEMWRPERIGAEIHTDARKQSEDHLAHNRHRRWEMIGYRIPIDGE